MRPPVLGWFLTLVAVAVVLRLCIAAVHIGIGYAQAAGRASYADSLRVASGGLCQQAEREPLRSLKGLPR